MIKETKEEAGREMDIGIGIMKEKEQGSAWLAIKFGCCASKDDVMDYERDAMSSTGRSRL